MLLGHVISDEPEVIRCFGSLINRHPRPATLPGVISSRPVSKWCATPRIPPPYPQPSWGFFRSLRYIFYSSSAELTFNSKEFECSGQRLSSKTPATDLHWFTACFPAATPALVHSSTSSAYLALLRSFASSNRSSQVHLKVPVSCVGEESTWGAWLLLCLLPSSDKEDSMLGGMLTLTALNRCDDWICQSPEDLIMAPAIPPIPQSLWTTTEDMLQCATPLAQLACWWVYQAPAV